MQLRVCLHRLSDILLGLRPKSASVLRKASCAFFLDEAPCISHFMPSTPTHTGSRAQLQARCSRSVRVQGVGGKSDAGQMSLAATPIACKAFVLTGYVSYEQESVALQIRRAWRESLYMISERPE